MILIYGYRALPPKSSGSVLPKPVCPKACWCNLLRSSAARQLKGAALEYVDQPEEDAVRQAAKEASAVVFGAASPLALKHLLPLMDSLRAEGRKVALVCLDAPYLAKQADHLPCVISCYDQTVQAIGCVCRTLAGKA